MPPGEAVLPGCAAMPVSRTHGPMRRKTLAWHVGYPKTGTSTVQRFAAENPCLMERLGVFYPSGGFHPAMERWPHHRVVLSAFLRRLVNLPGVADVAAALEITRRIRDQAQEMGWVDTLLVSHETFSQQMEHLDWAGWRAFCDPFDTRVVIYARRLPEWLESRYQHAIWAQASRQAIGPPPPPEIMFRTPALRRRSVSFVVDRIEAEMPGAPIVLRSFDRSREQGRLVPDFFSACGLAIDDATSQEMVNAPVENRRRPGAFTAMVHQLQKAAASPAVISALSESLMRLADQGTVYGPLAQAEFCFMTEDILRAAAAIEAADAARFDVLPAPRDPLREARSGRRAALTRQEYLDLADWLRLHLGDEVVDPLIPHAPR